MDLHPGYSQVDTCAGEFASETPYFYSSYWAKPKSAAKPPENSVVILGSGPNRIGQGIEFDYSCVRGVKAFRREGWHVVMVNSNPETVSTDYDTSNELYFEPLTAESVLEILHRTKPNGFVAQLGGQTPIISPPSLSKRAQVDGFHSRFDRSRGRSRSLFRDLSRTQFQNSREWNGHEPRRSINHRSAN